MQIHELKFPKKKSRKRIGRGGKRGTTSGRGTKGQRSRAGHRIRPASRDLIQRIPKLRGFRNKPKSSKPVTIDLQRLVSKTKTMGASFTVDKPILKQLGLISMRYNDLVKVLGRGEVKSSITLKGIGCSKGVKAIIEKAGGKIEK